MITILASCVVCLVLIILWLVADISTQLQSIRSALDLTTEASPAGGRWQVCIFTRVFFGR